MRLIAILFVLVLGISSCKKGDSATETIDPREQYVGTYDVDYSSKTIIGSIDFNEDSGKGVITITKGDVANEISMAIAFPNIGSSTEIAKLTGTKFTLNRTRDQLALGNKMYDAEFTGSGLFEGKNMTITSVTKMNQNGTVVQWTRAYKGIKR